ncbi:MAG: hypothetical protein ACQEUT_00540 [Bacillota bacterium]
MKEYIGECRICGKPVYCLDGFFNGVHDLPANTIICFQCTSQQEEVDK